MFDPAATVGTPGRAPVLAVDLGASNVKMAWLEGGQIVDSSARNAEFPTVVAWHHGDLQVGKDALELSARQPAAVLLHVREWLGLVPSVRLAGVDVKIDQAITALYRNAARATVRTTDRPASVIVHPHHGRNDVSCCWLTRPEPLASMSSTSFPMRWRLLPRVLVSTMCWSSTLDRP